MGLDKSKYLEASVESKNQRMMYDGRVEGQGSISIDYSSPAGDDMGYTSLELLLLSLGSCVSSTIGAILRNNGCVVSRISCALKGMRRQEHPTGFEAIDLVINLKSEELESADVDRAIAIAENGVCPVWCMLKDSVDISVSYEIS